MPRHHSTSSVGVTVAMAIDRPGPHVAHALDSIVAQNLRDMELLVVLNGPEGAGKGVRADRVFSAPGITLAAAMNLALREARHEFVARMDADDVSLPGRLEAQAGYLLRHPEIAAVGTSFERIDGEGRLIEICPAPTDAREVRWRLLIENCVAHGSAMLRRSAVLDAGGYDESCPRAQDYELWLRLTSRSACIANLPEALYRYRCDPSRRSDSGWRPAAEQAAVAADAMLRAWNRLPSMDVDGALREATAEGMTDPLRGVALLERLLTECGPTRERLGALLWTRARAADAPAQAAEAGRDALLRELAERLRESGVDRLWLWGAGRHTERLFRRGEWFEGEIVGIVDDDRAGTIVRGLRVQSPAALQRGDHVLLSSDLHEGAMWQSSAAARARGVVVWRLYGEPVSPPIGAAA